jgi:D-threonate/D-erythronate kinase
MSPFGVLADDLTGACDTGVQLSVRGARVLVLAAPEAAAPATSGAAAWDVVVRNTESRHLPPEVAARCVAQAAQDLATAGWPVRYKKIDSSLRGPLAAELAALRAGPGAAPTLVVCPAFPAAGRTVEQGVLRVGGVPVHETELGRDRQNPVPQSHLHTVLLGLGRVGQIGAVEQELGRPGVALRLGELLRQGAAVIVADATTDAHLDALAAAILPVWQTQAAPGARALVAVGSAGLARALAAGLLPQGGEPARPPRFPAAGPVLVVAGSRTAVTRGQVQALRAAPGVYSLVVDAALLDAPSWDAQAPAWVAAQADALAAAAGAGSEALAVSIAETAPAGAGADAAARDAERSRRLNFVLGALVAALLERLALGGLVLTGGDIAHAVLGALQADALQLGAEVLPGVPLAWPVGGARPGLPVVTKAGGFGGPGALLEAVHFLRRGGAQS